ncbi:MAG: DoxX family membrane protein [Pseudorhodobacter sp.]|nr:DoxX family membrane protein [Pseudorhodobacter sp.]MDN5787251.1 DoxX family membrane protein [Pseudorhodobacter sp.]
MVVAFSILVAFLTRAALIALFLPFSAVDKLINHREAVRQAQGAGVGPILATILIATGFTIEVIGSLGILTGLADRFAALTLAGYCAAAALLYKRFWATDDFALRGPSKGREVFWDFMKNFAVAGGFLLITFGTSAATVGSFFSDPLASSHPYKITLPLKGD